MKDMCQFLLVVSVAVMLCVQQGAAKGMSRLPDKADSWQAVKESARRPPNSQPQLNKMRLPNPVLVRHQSAMEKMARHPVLKVPHQVVHTEELTAQWEKQDPEL